jgi:hypothetical protein
MMPQFETDCDPLLPLGVEEVLMYCTKDGILHKDPDAATKHITISLENSLGELVDEVSRGLRVDKQLCTDAKIAVVNALVGTPEKAAQLKQLLDRLV